MLRATALAAAVLLSAAAAPFSPAAPPGGTPVNGGDRVQGFIDGASDRDVFLLEAPEGARLQVEIKASRGSALLPWVALRDPDGATLDISKVVVGQSTPAVSLRDLGLRTSGTFVVEVSGYGGTTGAYQAVILAVVDRKVRATVQVPAGGSATHPFTGWDGVRVAWSAKEKAGPGLAAGGLCCPALTDIEGSDGVRKGKGLVGPKTVLDLGPGRYGIVLEGNAGGATTVDLKANLKFPKVKRRRLLLGEEPRPAAMTPTTGRDGTVITLSGTGFAQGCRVFVDGVHEAPGAILADDGTLSAACPSCPASDAGSDVAVTVVNPDGQTGTLPVKFRYLGLPAAQWVVPALAPVEGGTTISVSGSKFRPGFTVALGGVPATDCVVQSTTLITCTTPAHVEGAVDVVVSDEFGRPGTPIPGFRFADAPAVSSAAPAALPSFGGRTVVLTGSHFVPGDRVFVNGVEASPVSVASWTTLSFTAPAGVDGPVDLEVRDVLDRSWSGSGVLAFTPSLQNASSSLPAGPTGSDFFGITAAFGDCTGDGRPDLVITTAVPKFNTVTGTTAPSTRLLVNNGSGGFTDGTAGLPSPKKEESSQGSALALGDLDGDGTAEILVSKKAPLRSADDFVTYQGLPGYYTMEIPGSYDRPTLRATRLLVRGSTGTSTDQGASRLPDPGVPPAGGLGERWQAAASAMGDLDGDGTPDLLLVAGSEIHDGSISNVQWITQYQYYYPYYFKVKSLLFQETAPKGAVRPLLNDGGGALVDGGSGPGILAAGDATPLDDFRGDACALGDLDGDGTLDAVVVGNGPSLRDGDGTFVASSAARVLLNDGSGRLSFSPGMTAANYADDHPGCDDFAQGVATALGDLDGDGDLDLVVGRNSVGYWTDGDGVTRVLPALRILRNGGEAGLVEDTAGFLPDPLFRTGGGPTILGARGVALVDLDGDGDLDLVVTGRETTVVDAGGGKGARGILDAGTRVATRVLLNDGTGRFADATGEWLQAPAGDWLRADALCTTDVDGDGRPDLALVLDASPGVGLRPLRLFKTR